MGKSYYVGEDQVEASKTIFTPAKMQYCKQCHIQVVDVRLVPCLMILRIKSPSYFHLIYQFGSYGNEIKFGRSQCLSTNPPNN